MNRLATNPHNTTLVDLIERTPISEVWQALGGPEPRNGRGRAFWRDGTSSRSVSIDSAKGAWYDHGTGCGGGVLALIATVTGTDRRGAVEWLAHLHGVELERQNPAARQDWRRRREAAERQAAELAAWRQAERRRLIEKRNHHFDVAAIATAGGRLLLAEGDSAPESAWDLVWQYALDDHQGDVVQRRLDHLEAMPPGELAAYRARAEAVAA